MSLTIGSDGPELRGKWLKIRHRPSVMPLNPHSPQTLPLLSRFSDRIAKCSHSQKPTITS